jgi:hypothetical protein
MSRSDTSSPPQAPSWRVVGLLYFNFIHHLGVIKMTSFRKSVLLPSSGQRRTEAYSAVLRGRASLKSVPGCGFINTQKMDKVNKKVSHFRQKPSNFDWRKPSKAVPPHTTEALGEERRYSSYSFSTSALCGDGWSASLSGRALASGKVPPVHIVQEAGWALEPVWTQRLEEKSFRLCRVSNLDRPVVQS